VAEVRIDSFDPHAPSAMESDNSKTGLFMRFTF
jgi:hypothetical protein